MKLKFTGLATLAAAAALMALGMGRDGRTEEQQQATKAAEKIAAKVEQKAKQTEKAEGNQNLVQDKVTVKAEKDGTPIIEQVGEASFYGEGDGFHGRKTANGEKFDKNAATAAHPTLPLGTEATVTNLETGKSVDVKINDRGPYVKGRDIDLSAGAAKAIGISKDGVAPVKIEAEVKPEPETQKVEKEKTRSGRKLASSE